MSGIGYYAHHQGHGHLHRATAVGHAVPGGLTGLSTHRRPDAWTGRWVELADDKGRSHDASTTAGGWLHYAPLGHPGFDDRMRAIATWVAQSVPAALVADVSVEVALLGRLLGVPVVSVALPGRRTDRPHALGYAASDLVVAPWPAEATDVLDTGDAAVHPVALGAISRYAPLTEAAVVDERRVLVLGGSGGGGPSDELLDAVAYATPGWDWTVLSPRRWVADPWPQICGAGVVVSHCGQNAVAEIAAARRPAVLVPQDRPFDEQRHLARALRELGMPALVLDAWPAPEQWDRLLKEAADLDPAGWAVWNDGCGAERFATLLASFDPGASGA